MEDKISIVNVFNYLVKKCNNKLIEELADFVDDARLKLSAGNINISEFTHDDKQYYGLWTSGALGKAYGAVYLVDNGKLSLIDSGVISNYPIVRSSNAVEFIKSKLLNIEQNEDHDEEPDNLEKQPTDGILDKEGIKYRLISSSSKGRYNSIYGSDNIVIEIVDNTPEADVRRTFGGPLTVVSKVRDNVYSITYYRD